MIFACIFSLSSCAIVPVYDSIELAPMLEEAGYKVDIVMEEVQEGISGYVHAENRSTGDELYYIYCDNMTAARSVYVYIKSKNQARAAELQLEIDKIEHALYKSEGISAKEKGEYYEKLVERTEELEEVQNYKYGHALNIVWYGTKQAVSDIKW